MGLRPIDQNTFDLLEVLSSRKDLHSFALGGGTALALQLGHRISVDLDFLTESEFDSVGLGEGLGGAFEVENSSTSANSLALFIRWQGTSVKTDFIRHNYRRLKPLINVGGIRLFSLEDIAAMKLNAIANRGAKKDFYDIHALLPSFALPEMLGFFELKYRTMNSFTVTKSLAYFDDADLEPDPISLGTLTWEEIKADLKVRLKNSS